MSGRGMSGFRLSGVFWWVAIGVAVVACDDDSDALGERGSSETDASDAGPDATLAESGQCGNGRIDTFDDGLGHYGVEGCDDGNRQAGDGCSASCSVEDGFECNDERPQNCTESTGSASTVGAGGKAGSNDPPNASSSGGGGGAGLGGETSMANGGSSAGQGGDGVGGQGTGATSNEGVGGDNAPLGGQGGDDGAGGFGGNAFNPIGTGGVGGAGLGGSESQSGGAGGGGGGGGAQNGGAGAGGAQSGGTGGGGAGGGSGPGPEGCPNDDIYTLPMDQTLLIAAECNAFDVAGAWTCMDDGVRPSGCVGADPIFRDGEGVCLSGPIANDPTSAAWGAQLGATLAGSGGQGASFNASAQDIVGFSVAITGSSGGAALRISFESTNSGSILPFIEVPGPGTYDVLFEDAMVPLSWMVAESGAKPDPTALVAIHVQIVGGDRFANYDFCIESMRALGENVPEP